MDKRMNTWGYWAESLEEITDMEFDNAYDEWLNEIEEWPTIAGEEFAPSDILKEFSPITYRVGRADYHSFMIEDGLIFEELPAPECDYCGNDEPEPKEHVVYGLICGGCLEAELEED